MIPTNLYEVRLYDHANTFRVIPQNITRIEFHQRLNAPWNHLIEMQMSVEDDDVDVIRSITDDWQIRIYRTNPVTFIKEKVYEGLHATTVDQVDATGDLMFTLYGYGYTQFLMRRVVVPLTGEKSSTKAGAAETVIKNFVADACVTPTDAERTISGLTIAADYVRGELVERSARYVNLMTVCEGIANSGKLDFGIYGGTEVGTFIFDARSLWGTDRRVSNTEGNRPTVFSLSNNTIDIPILSINASEEKNFAYIGGEGSEETRNIESIAYLNAVGRTPWWRKEAFVEGRQQESLGLVPIALTGPLAVGLAYLEDNRLKQTLNFDIRPTTVGARWLIDWELGDLVTARYFTYEFDKKITQVDVTVTSNESAELFETVKIEIEDVRQ